jgi:plasmid stabilization system protein ParE
MKKVLFLEEAKTELIDIVDYYEQIYPGLGLDFEQEVKKVLDLILEFPDICSELKDGTKRMSTHRFPYQVIFYPSGTVLWIIAVAHHKRFPAYWRNRLKSGFEA